MSEGLPYGWVGSGRRTNPVHVGFAVAAVAVTAGLGFAALPIPVAAAVTGAIVFAALLAILHLALRALVALLVEVPGNGCSRVEKRSRASADEGLLTSSRGERMGVICGAANRATAADCRGAASLRVGRRFVDRGWLTSGFVAFLVFAMSGPILYVRYGWAPVAFLLAMRAQQRRRSRVEA